MPINFNGTNSKGVPSISTDAWGKNKVAQDFSLSHAMFTFEIPSSVWKESINGVEQSSITNATSVDGELALTSNGVLNDKVALDTLRSPRYQPNRGHLWSASLFFDNPNAAGERTCGIFTEEAGVGVRLRGTGASWNMYLVVRTTIGVTTTDTETEITEFPAGFDPSKGNIYDIQMQWRGVGNFKVFIGDSASGGSEQVLIVKNLNLVDNLTIFNPALPIAYECINQGADVTIRSGCVDVTSEGGGDDKGVYGSIGIENDAGQVAISGFNVPVLVVKNGKNLNGNRNTRDILVLLLTAYADQKSIIRVWGTREETAITLNDQSWQNFRGGAIEYLQYDFPDVTTPITFDTNKAELIFTARVDQDQSYATSALFEGRSDIFQNAGDIFVFTMHRENGTGANAGITYEFAEEI